MDKITVVQETRKTATQQDIHRIAAEIMALKFETEGGATLFEAIDFAMKDSEYATFGTVSPSDMAVDMRAEAVAEALKQDDEDSTCSACNGCGEGQHEGTTCWKCKGRGETDMTERYGVII